MRSHGGVDSGSALQRRRVRTASGEQLDPAEPQVASQVSRLGVRLGTARTIDGFAAWRGYAFVRRLWRLIGRVR